MIYQKPKNTKAMDLCESGLFNSTNNKVDNKVDKEDRFNKSHKSNKKK
jgi:hypothetical protein